MENSRLVHSPFGHKKMQVRWKLTARPGTLDGKLRLGNGPSEAARGVQPDPLTRRRTDGQTETEIHLRVVGTPGESTRILLYRLGLRLPNGPNIIENVEATLALPGR